MTNGETGLLCLSLGIEGSLTKVSFIGFCNKEHLQHISKEHKNIIFNFFLVFVCEGASGNPGLCSADWVQDRQNVITTLGSDVITS